MIDVLKIVETTKDSVVTFLNDCLQRLKLRDSGEYNWLNKIEKILWGRIISWWPKLKVWLHECIQRYKEIVLLDTREDGGRELIEAIQEVLTDTEMIDDIDNGPVAVCVNKDNTIDKIVIHQAEEVAQQDQYDSMQASHNGILRING